MFAEPSRGTLLFVLLMSPLHCEGYADTGKPQLGAATDLGVSAVLQYIRPSPHPLQLVRDTNGRDSGVPTEEVEPTNVFVHNGRRRDCMVDREGFQLIQSTLTPANVNFLDGMTVVSTYYPDCEALLRSVLGEDVLVKAFDHNVRMAEPSDDAKIQKPIGLVHGDYTEVSAPRRLMDLAKPPKINDVLRESPLQQSWVDECIQNGRRFSLINVWRSIDRVHAIESDPLACATVDSVDRSHLRTLQIHYADRIGENYLVTPSEEHEWVYFPDMTQNEALLIQQWDSKGDRFSVHSAFGLPEPGRPRSSIEVRCVCLWP